MTTMENKKRKVRFTSSVDEPENDMDELPTDDEVKGNGGEEDVEVPEKKLKVDNERKSKGKEEESQSQSSDQSQPQQSAPKEDDDERFKSNDRAKSIIKKFLCPHRQAM